MSKDARLLSILGQESRWPEYASQVFVLLDMRIVLSTHPRDSMLHYECLLAAAVRQTPEEGAKDCLINYWVDIRHGGSLSRLEIGSSGTVNNTSVYLSNLNCSQVEE